MERPMTKGRSNVERRSMRQNRGTSEQLHETVPFPRNHQKFRRFSWSTKPILDGTAVCFVHAFECCHSALVDLNPDCSLKLMLFEYGKHLDSITNTFWTCLYQPTTLRVFAHCQLFSSSQCFLKSHETKSPLPCYLNHILHPMTCRLNTLQAPMKNPGCNLLVHKFRDLKKTCWRLKSWNRNFLLRP